MSNQSTTTEDDTHLADVPDGAGCTEIWEHLSGDRDAKASGSSDADEHADSA